MLGWVGKRLVNGLATIGTQSKSCRPVERFSPLQSGLQRRPYKLEYDYGLEKYKPHIYPRRCGVIGIKVGMMALFDKFGKRMTITVVQLEDNHVTQIKTPEKEGFYAVQVGARNGKDKHVRAPQRRHCEKAGVPVKRLFKEFRVTGPEQLIPVGTPITARHFVPGQFVDVQGTTIGKGFQGVMKRFGFKGQPASHGVSLAHRSLGSTGTIAPGRVFKGKKMPGRMGNKTRTVQNLCVHRIDVERGLLYLMGHVPGHKGGTIYIKDAVKKPNITYEKKLIDVPMPTWLPSDDDKDLPNILEREVTRNVLEEPLAGIPG